MVFAESESASNFFFTIPIRAVLFFVITVLVFKYIVNKFSRDPRFLKVASEIPGPLGLPYIGNSLSFILAGKDGQVQLQKDLIKKYGSIYRIWVGKQLVVGLSDIEHLKIVFLNSKLMGKGEMFEAFNHCFGNGLFTTLSVPEWKADRKRLQPYFTKDVINYLVPEMNKSVYKVVKKMEKFVNGPEFDITDTIYDLSLDFITRTAYDYEAGSDETLIKELKNELEKAVNVLSAQTFLPLLKSKGLRYILDKFYVMPSRNNFLNYTKKIISKKLDAIKSGTYVADKNKVGGPFTNELLLSSYNLIKEGGPEKEIHMLEEVLTIILAGSETTMRTITFCLLMIAMNSEIQDQLYEEIKEVFGDDDRQADMRDCERLIYLNQVIKETLRRFTLFPTIFREAEEDIKIGSYVFPAGTSFMVNIASVHFNSEFYPNPFEFNPDNFSPEAVKNRSKYAFIPFSAGPRNCIGKQIAELEIQLAITAILRAYKLHTTKTMDDLKINFGVVGRSENGIWIGVTPRKQKIF